MEAIEIAVNVPIDMALAIGVAPGPRYVAVPGDQIAQLPPEARAELRPYVRSPSASEESRRRCDESPAGRWGNGRLACPPTIDGIVARLAVILAERESAAEREAAERAARRARYLVATIDDGEPYLPDDELDDETRAAHARRVTDAVDRLLALPDSAWRPHDSVRWLPEDTAAWYLAGSDPRVDARSRALHDRGVATREAEEKRRTEALHVWALASTDVPEEIRRTIREGYPLGTTLADWIWSQIADALQTVGYAIDYLGARERTERRAGPSAQAWRVYDAVAGMVGADLPPTLRGCPGCAWEVDEIVRASMQTDTYTAVSVEVTTPYGERTYIVRAEPIEPSAPEEDSDDE